MTEDYVSFETAKLLKENGFDEKCFYCFDDVIGESRLSRLMICNNSELVEHYYSAPTLQMAMKWLREVHSLYIDIITSFSQDGICYTFSCFNTMDLIQGTKGTSYHEYQTHEEACEIAIKYCLENLI